MGVEIRNQKTGAVFTVPEEGAVFGRTGGPADITVDEPTASKRHAQVNRAERGWVLADLGSVNGTRIDGRAIQAPVLLKVGLQFRIGSTSFEVVSLGRPPGSYVIAIDGGGKRRTGVFASAEITIGRVAGNDIILPHESVSKRHARIARRDGVFIIVDLRSSSGTTVNGKPVAAPTVLKAGAVVEIGPFRLTIDTEGRSTAALLTFDQLPQTPPHPMALPPEARSGPAPAVRPPPGRPPPGRPPAVPPSPAVPLPRVSPAAPAPPPAPAGNVLDDDVEAVPPSTRPRG
jgi:pSer/pThr/pTyr-binding forkhead associated (FHA) protein